MERKLKKRMRWLNKEDHKISVDQFINQDYFPVFFLFAEGKIKMIFSKFLISFDLYQN